VIHDPVTCTCDFVDPYDFNSFARKGDVFHIVDFLSEEEHTIPCEDMTMDDVPSDVYQINCVDCLKMHIRRLTDQLRKYTDEVPF
jgi:hypothetical protein